MPKVISLKDVVDELEGLMDEFTAYLNCRTGEVVTISHEDGRMIEDEVELEDLPEWQREWIPKVKEVLESDDPRLGSRRFGGGPAHAEQRARRRLAHHGGRYRPERVDCAAKAESSQP